MLIMDDLKKEGFSRGKKLKNKSTYLLYVYLYYNIFQNKFDFILDNEFKKPDMVLRMRFFEYALLYVRSHGEDKPKGNSKILTNIIQTFKSISSLYFKTLS